MDSSKQLLKNTSIYALGDIIPRAVNFVFFPILTHYLTPADYGILNYVSSINNFLTIITFLCLNTYYMVYYNRVDSDEERKKLLGNISIFVIGINLVLCIFLFGLGPFVFGLFGDNIPFYPYIAIGVLTNFFNIFSVLPSCLLRMQERPALFTVINVSKAVLVTLFTALLVIYFKFGVNGALTSNLVITFIAAIIFVIITYRNAIFKWNNIQIKEALAFSLPLLPGSIAYYFVTMSDRLLINKYLTLSDLGLYSTASSLALLMNTVSYGAYKAFEPYIFKIYLESDFSQKIRKVSDNYCYLLLIIALGIALLSKDFLVLFTDSKYFKSADYVPLLVVGCFFSSFSYLFGSVITAAGKTKLSSYISIIGGVISVVLNVLLLRFGVVFACVTSAISFFIMWFLNYYYSNVKLKIWSIIPYVIVIVLAVLFFLWVDFDSIYVDIIVKLIVFFVITFWLYVKSDIKIWKKK